MEASDNSPYALVEKTIRSLQSEKQQLASQLESERHKNQILRKKIQEKDRVNLDLKVDNDQLLQQQEVDNRQREILNDLVTAEGRKAEFLAHAIQSFQSGIGNLRLRLENSNEWGEAAKKLILNMEEEIEKMKEENFELEEKLDESEDMNEKLKKRFEECKAYDETRTIEIDNLRLENEKLGDELSEAKEVSTKLNVDLELWKKSLAETEQEKEALSVAHAAFEKEVEIKMKELNGKNLELEFSLTGANESLALEKEVKQNLQEEIKTLNEQEEELKGLLMEQNEHFKTLKGEIEDCNSAISKVAQEKEAICVAYADLEKDANITADGLKKMINELESSLVNINAQIDQERKVFEQQLETLREEKNDNEKQLKEEKDSIELAMTKVLEKQEELTSAYLNLQRTSETDRTSLESKILELESSFRRTKANLESENESLEKQLKSSMTKESEMLKSLADAQTKMQHIGAMYENVVKSNSKRASSPLPDTVPSPAKKVALAKMLEPAKKLEPVRKLNFPKPLPPPKKSETKRESRSKKPEAGKAPSKAQKKEISPIKADNPSMWSIFSDTSLSDVEMPVRPKGFAIDPPKMLEEDKNTGKVVAVQKESVKTYQPKKFFRNRAFAL